MSTEPAEAAATAPDGLAAPSSRKRKQPPAGIAGGDTPGGNTGPVPEPTAAPLCRPKRTKVSEVAPQVEAETPLDVLAAAAVSVAESDGGTTETGGRSGASVGLRTNNVGLVARAGNVGAPGQRLDGDLVAAGVERVPFGAGEGPVGMQSDAQSGEDGGGAVPIPESGLTSHTAELRSEVALNAPVVVHPGPEVASSQTNPGELEGSPKPDDRCVLNRGWLCDFLPVDFEVFALQSEFYYCIEGRPFDVTMVV